MVRSFPAAHAQHTITFDFLLMGRDDIRELSDFFYEMRGKWGEFFVPSWHPELEAAVGIDYGENELYIEPIGYADLFGEDTGTSLAVPENLGNHIFLLHDEGDLHLSAVESVTGTDPEILNLSEPVSRDFEVGRFIAGFLYWVRFTTDELELEYIGPETAKCSLVFQEGIAT
jgi:hypothetical protein